MSDGRRVKQLSLRYKDVKCSNCHSCGLIFRTLPKDEDKLNELKFKNFNRKLTCYFYSLP